MIYYRLATFEDNKQLLELTSSLWMPGKMALRIDRNPNFFELNKLRGRTNVYVAIEDHSIVGSICVSHEKVYINKEQYSLYYISDFKVAQTHRNRGIGFQLTNEVVNYLETENADFAFLNVSKGNKRPFIFFSDRAQYPDFENIGLFKIFQFIGFNKKNFKSKYNIKLTEGNSEILEFLNDYYSRHELANVITKEKIQGTQLFEVRQKTELIAAMCLIDTMEMKQNVVIKMTWYLKFLVSFINGISSIFKMSKLPKENEPVNMLYIKYLAVKTYDKALIASLISHARQCAYQKSYSFVSLGLHERDPLIKNLPNILKFTFNSIGMLVSLKRSQELMEKVQKGVPYKDYSIV